MPDEAAHTNDDRAAGTSGSPEIEAANSVPIDDLELTVRARVVFDAAKIRTLQELAGWTAPSLMSLPKCGLKILEEARTILEAHGLSLRDDSVSKRAMADFDPDTKVALGLRVTELSLSNRATNVLINAGVQLVGDLVSYRDTDLLKLPSCGRKTVQEIRSTLAKLNLRFGMDIVDWDPKFARETRTQNRYFAKVRRNVVASLDAATQDALELRVTELNFSRRTINVLLNAGVEFVGDLVRYRESQLLRLHACGKTTLQEIRATLARLSLSLGMKIADWDPKIARRNRESQDKQKAVALAKVRQIVIPLVSAASLEQELSSLLRAVVKERDVDIALKFFGWSGRGRRTLESVAEDYKITRERVRQITTRAARKIQDCKLEAPLLVRAVDFVRERCPAISSTLAKDLKAASLTETEFDVSGLETACEVLGINFGVVRRQIGSMNIYEAKAKIDELADVYRTCRRLTSSQGCLNFDSVCDEFDVSHKEREKYREILTAGKLIEWLDNERQWLFAWNRPRNRLYNLVAKVLAVSQVVNLAELRRAVARSRRLEALPPAAVLASFVEKLGLGKVAGNQVTKLKDVPGAIEPGSAEEIMVRVLRANGSVLGWDRMQDLCKNAGMNPITVGIYLSNSPLIARITRGVYALVGANVPPGLVEEIAHKLSRSRKPAEFGWSSRGTLWCSFRVTQNILTTGAVAIPAFVCDLTSNTEWEVHLGGRPVDKTVKSRNHFLWSIRRTLAAAGAEPDDTCILEFKIGTGIVSLTVGGEELADVWDSGEIDLLTTETQETTDILDD